MKNRNVFFVFIPLLSLMLFHCDDSTSSAPFSGEFGDQYVFLEFRSYSETEGATGRTTLQQYVFEDDEFLNIGFPPTITDPTDKFVLIYGLNLTFTGSYNGNVKFAQKAEKVPHTVNFGEFTQSDVSIPIDVKFKDIGSNGDVTLSIAGTDPDTTRELEYSVVLHADSTYAIPAEFTYPTTINGDTAWVTSTYELENYGFQEKQNISIQSGQ